MSYCISDLIYVSDRLTVTFLLAGPRSGPDNTEKLVWNIVKISSSQSDLVITAYSSEYLSGAVWRSEGWLEGKPGGSVFVYLIFANASRVGLRADCSQWLYLSRPLERLWPGVRPPTGKIVPWPVSPSKMIFPVPGLETEDNMKLSITASFVSTDLSRAAPGQPVATEKTKDRDGCQSVGRKLRPVEGKNEISLWTGTM